MNTTESVLNFFREITRIPRESGHEEQIVAYLQRFAASRGLKCKIEVDGGVGLSNAKELHKAGVDIAVAGSAVFGAPDPAKAISVLRGA